MISLFSKKATTLVGLDIGTKYIKAVCLKVTSEHTELLACAREPIFGNPFSERDIKDYDPISKCLKKIKHGLKYKSKHCSLAVSGPSVITKIVHMDPNQNDFELENQIELEADSLIPYPLEEVYVDFEEIGDSETHAGKVDVLLSAAHKEFIDSRITIVREQSIEPVIVDVETNALSNALLQYSPLVKETDNYFCCFNLGASLLQMTVVKDSKVIFNKEMSFGLNKLHQDISLVMGVEIEEVNTKIAMNEAPPEWFETVMPGFVNSLQQQIQRALQLHGSSSHNKPPTTLLLSGGLPSMKDICEELSQDLGVKVDTFNPFETMLHSKQVDAERVDKFGPQFAVAVGLASRNIDKWQI